MCVYIYISGLVSGVTLGWILVQLWFRSSELTAGPRLVPKAGHLL